MRRTLHFVAADDIRWMLALLAPRIIAGSIGRHRRLGIDAPVMARSRKTVTASLRDGRQLTRKQMYDALTRARISPAGQRGIHILARLAMEGVLCFASHVGKEP